MNHHTPPSLGADSGPIIDPHRYLYAALALVLVVTGSIIGLIKIGPIVVAILGGAGLVGFVCWLKTTWKYPATPAVVLPWYLLTIAALMVHITEEYITDFPGQMSHHFGVAFDLPTFTIVIAMIGFVIWILAAYGLLFRNPLANYVAWFIFAGMIFFEGTHFIFPALTGEPYGYFSGMYTALIPLIPAVFGMRALIRDARESHRILGGEAGEGDEGAAGASA